MRQTTGPENTAGDLAGVMQRGGFYNRHSLPQHAAAPLGQQLIERAVEAIPLPQPGFPFLIADFGAAQGANSLMPIGRAIGAVRRRLAAEVPIAVVHTDIPADDFSTLFSLVETSPDSYLRDTANVFPFAAGRTFYRQIFPAGSLSLGWSAIAVHWLSAAPATIERHIWSPRADRETLAAFRAQSARDWWLFLAHRAVEMRPGARLIVIGGGSDDAGDSAADGLMDMANDALLALLREGRLDAEEYRHMAIPTYNRTPAEFVAPFAEDADDLGLVLEHSELQILPDPLFAEYEESKDRAAFADSYIDFFAAAFSPSIFSALSSRRSSSARQSIIRRFEEALRERIIDRPAAAVCRWRVFVMLIAKPA
ncbi:MAG TPA: hypothetical protein VGF34_17215 [Stellaceae bacterium]